MHRGIAYCPQCLQTQPFLREPLKEQADMFKHILLATDGSAASGHAARIAVELARTHGARLTSLYVVDPYPYLGIGESNPLGFQSYMSAAHEHAVQAHAQAASLCSQGGAPVALETRVCEDLTASEGIVKTATDEAADLIVMASHGRTGLARLVLGSVTAKVLAAASIPVLITR